MPPRELVAHQCQRGPAARLILGPAPSQPIQTEPGLDRRRQPGRARTIEPPQLAHGQTVVGQHPRPAGGLREILEPQPTRSSACSVTLKQRGAKSPPGKSTIRPLGWARVSRRWPSKRHMTRAWPPALPHVTPARVFWPQFRTPAVARQASDGFVSQKVKANDE